MADARDVGSCYTKGGELWDLSSLTRLTDEVRACLGNGTKLTDEQVEVVYIVIKRLLDDDKIGIPQGLDFIAKTRFDLLVRDILNPGTQSQEVRNIPERLEMRCFALQRTWRRHFKASIFVAMIDEERHKDMEAGSLQRVTLESRKEGKWTVDEAKPESHSHTEGSLEFQAGQWWLNIACCYRDGIVGKMADDMTSGPYGVTAIPLLSGEEIKSDIADCFTYRRTGQIEDMYLPLMSQLGQKNVRILRGYKLKGPNAPKAGIRYDGLYTPIEYSHKFNQVTTRYEVKIVFKKSWGTPPVETLRHIPTPSQMDEWKLYLIIFGDLTIVHKPNRIRLVPQNEERGSGLLRDPEFIEALKTSCPSEVMMKPEASKKMPDTPGEESGKSSQTTDLTDLLDESPTLLPKSSPPSKQKKLIPQGREETGELMKSSDFLDMLNEGPHAPPPTKSAISKNKKKLIPQGNEERGGDLMRSSDFMDMLNEGPDDPSPKSSVAALVTTSKPAKKAAPVMRPISANKMRRDGDAEEEPKIVKKRVKARDPYDIDAMLADCEDEE